MGSLDFTHPSKLFSLTFPFGSVNVGAILLLLFLSFSFKATNSSSDKSGAELEVLADDRPVVVMEEAAARLTSVS